MIFATLILVLIGFILVLVGSTGVLGYFGILPGFFGGIMMLMSTMTLIGPIIKDGLTPYFTKLRDDEEISHYITRRGKTFPIIVTNRKEGVLYYKKHFFADTKGAELTTLSGKPASITLQRYGFTLDPIKTSYMSKLKLHKKLKSGDEYEDALRHYLGPEGYKIFVRRFRTKKPLPDKYDIQTELKWLLDFQKPADALEYNIAGEKVGWKDILGFMIYSYDTNATENAIEREKLDIMLRNKSYNPEAVKAIGYAIAIVIVIIGIGIAFYMFQNINLGAIFGGGT